MDGQGPLGMTYGVLIAQSEVFLSVALGDFNSVINVLDGHGVVGDVLDAARATSTLQVGRQGRGHTGPDLDAGTVLDIVLAFALHRLNQ
jgi:hypothetical protein